jgi:hypothetical protein
MHKPSSPWTPIAVVLAFALVLGGLEAWSLDVGMDRLGQPITWTGALASTLPGWLVKAVLAWPIRLLSRHARLGPATWPTRLPIHLLGAALFALAAPIGNAFVDARLGLLGREPMVAAATRYFYLYLAYQVVIYWALVGAFHALDYLRESEQRERERARLATSLTEAKLNALRSQLSPHFFFNTLNAIATFALQGRPAQVGEMVGSLGDLVRVSLDDQLGHSVPLERELGFLGLYLDIQRTRFADWLRIEQEIDPAAGDVLVPSLMLQPLVENAIEHGVQDEDGIAHVRIRCALEGAVLAIEVSNLDHDRRAAPGLPPREGVGLANTRARLEQLYPGCHEFRFGPGAAGRFVVAVRIPARRAGTGVTAVGAAS